jgi:tRNA threonylcarbamoyladenosine biosynthesis protein TsaE
MTSYPLPDATATMLLGESFAKKAQAGDVFALVGTLGAGKTHWTKGFVSALAPDADVTSPTFGIVNEYKDGKLPIFHFDFYRLKSNEELIALGWDEYLEEAGIIICEWADLFPDLMPANTQWLEISHQPDGTRILKITKQ